MCVHYPRNIVFTPVIAMFIMQVCNHVYTNARCIHLSLFWENINNDTLEYS
jgi:hypothetical protein